MKSLAQIEASGKWLKLFAAQDFYQTIALARAMHPNATEHVIAMEAQYLLRQLMHEIGSYVSRIPKRPAQLRPSHVARCTGYRRATGEVKAQRNLTTQEAKEMAMKSHEPKPHTSKIVKFRPADNDDVVYSIYHRRQKRKPKAGGKCRGANTRIWLARDHANGRSEKARINTTLLAEIQAADASERYALMDSIIAGAKQQTTIVPRQEVAA